MSAMDVIDSMRAQVGETFDFDGSFFDLSPPAATTTAVQATSPPPPTVQFYPVGDPCDTLYAARLSTGARGWFVSCGSGHDYSVVVIFGLDEMYRAYVQAHGDGPSGLGLPPPWCVVRLTLSQEERSVVARRVRGARTAAAILEALSTVLVGTRRTLVREFAFRTR